MTQTQQTKEQPKGPRIQDSEWTYVLCAEGDVEDVKAIWAEKYPESQAKIVSEIRIQRLLQTHTVIPMRRKPRATAVSECEPVSVRQHWSANGQDGDVDERTFFRAVAKSALPAIPSIRSDLKTFKLSYA